MRGDRRPRREPRSESRLLTGWGRTSPTRAEVVYAEDVDDVVAAVSDSPPRGVVARGLGRAYGDAAQCAGGRVVDCTPMSGILALDVENALVRVRAGTSLDTLMRRLVPLGLFVPVTPGTRQVTVGGAIAADVHGKNHHRAGTFCAHVRRLTLLLADGTVREVSPVSDGDLFWATAGGMGMTGVVLEAVIQMERVETSRLAVDTIRCPDLERTMEEMLVQDRRHPYTVAWIDLMAAGRAMGRSVITAGRFATEADLPPPMRSRPLAFETRPALPAPPWAPSNLLNRLTVAAFNELWFRKAPARREGEIQTIGQFFHPLDMVEGWNRLYGRRGFLQWQCVLPEGAEKALQAIVERLVSARCTSFLAVLKRFGAANPGPLSFPMAGWTLSLDIPGGLRDLGPLLDELDRMVATNGGRLYLAKDSRMRPEILEETYPRLDAWREVREKVDPGHRLQSDLGRRLGL